MTRFKYALLVAAPALVICWPVGKSAKAIEQFARKVRLKCAGKMRRVLDGAPPIPQETIDIHIENDGREG